MTRHLVRFGLYLVIGYLYFGVALPAQTPSKEYIRVNGRVVAIESLPCATASSTLSFHSTGMNNGVLLNDGAVDPNWKMVSNPGAFATTNAIVRTTGAIPVSPNTKHINPNGTSAILPPGAYVYRQRLDLACHDPATVSISGLLAANDNAQVFVNGKPVLGQFGSNTVITPFTLSGSSGAFIRGWNQIDFLITNIGPADSTHSTRIEITSATATVVPAANGTKFEVAATPAGGNKNGTSIVTLSSGSENVTWAFEGAASGTLSGTTANTTTYTGPGSFSAPAVVIVKATSTAPGGAVTYQPLWFNPGGTGGSVTISGSTANLAPYSTRALTAAVTGLPAGQDTVRWSVVSVPASSSSNGLISTGTNCIAPPASMTYRAPSTITTAGNIVLKAESCSNAALSSTISIAAAAASSVSVLISPKPTSVTGSYSFASLVSSADSTSIVWSVTPTAAGTINSTGVFTAALGFTGGATVRAQSVENASKFDDSGFTITAFTPATEPLNFFSTGIQSVDSSGVLSFVPGNGMDLHWLTTSILGDESFIVGPAPVYMLGNASNDTAIARYASYAVGTTESRPQSAVAVHSQWIYLEGNDTNTVSITGRARMDDYGRIFVNDQLIYGNGSDANGYWGYMWYAYVNYSINSASGGNAAGKFVNGWNKISFEIKNFPGCCTVGFGLEAASTSSVLRTAPKGAAQVRIVPTSSTLTTNQKTTLAAVLSNSARHEQAINWSMSPSNLGTLTSTPGGNVAIFQAGAGTGTVTLTATSAPFSAQSASIQIQINPSQTNGSTFVSGSSTLPPSTLASAQTFNVALAFQNTGTTTWAAGTYSVASDNGVNWGTNSASLASNISPGATATFNFTLTAPTVASAQAVAFSWRMRDASNAFFGAVASQSTTISPSNIQLSLAPTGGQLGYGTPRTYTITATGFVAGQNRTINLSRSSTNASYLGSLSATSVSISGTGATGTATFSYTAQACGQFCASPAPVITITATSAQDPSRTAVDQFSLTLPIQTISATMTSTNRKATFNITVTDPNTDTQITWAEFVLSPQSGSNGFPAGESCRFRINRTTGQFQAGLDNSSGGSTYIYGTLGGGTLEQPGDPNPNACRILLGSSSGNSPDGKTWNVTLTVENLKMTGTRYLRGQTYAGATSIPAPDSFLGPTWTLGALPVISISNSLNVAVPVIAEGQSLDLYMQVANLCPGCKAKFRLVQQNEGSLTSVSNPAGYSAQANFAATTNAGTDRDIFVVTTIYLNQTAWQNEDATQTDCSEDTCMASPYRIRVTSSFSSTNLPSFPITNPFVGSGLNPQPLNAIVTANGTTSHLIQFAVQNGPYDALATSVNAIDEYYFNINRTFTQSGLAQDSAGGCQLRFAIFTGSANKNYFLYLKGDSGASDVGSIFGSLPETATGVLSNSQCKVEIGSSIGTYAQTASSNPTVLGFGIRVTFFTPFSGERYVFMQSNRVNNGWTGWQYRGTMNMQ